MKLVATVTSIAVATLLAGTAFAAEPYIGLSRTTPGEAYIDFATAKHVRNYNSPVAVKVYGGIKLTDRYGIEVGYGDFGTWKIANPAPGSTEEVRMASKVFYVAGTARMPVSEAFSLFGKFGLAANKFTSDRDVFQGSSGSKSSVRPLLGFGIDYKVTQRLSAVLEYNYYGTVGNGSQQQKAELGLKYAF